MAYPFVIIDKFLPFLHFPITYVLNDIKIYLFQYTNFSRFTIFSSCHPPNGTLIGTYINITISSLVFLRGKYL